MDRGACWRHQYSFSAKGQLVNILSFVGYMVSVEVMKLFNIVIEGEKLGPQGKKWWWLWSRVILFIQTKSGILSCFVLGTLNRIWVGPKPWSSCLSIWGAKITYPPMPSEHHFNVLGDTNLKAFTHHLTIVGLTKARGRPLFVDPWDESHEKAAAGARSWADFTRALNDLPNATIIQ